MRIFINRYGYEVSNTTMHKYMNKELNLCAVIMHSKPRYKARKKHKIFDNLLNQNFTVNCKNKVYNNIKEARAAIERYIHSYNFERCHSALDYKTPAECYYPAITAVYSIKHTWI